MISNCIQCRYNIQWSKRETTLNNMCACKLIDWFCWWAYRLFYYNCKLFFIATIIYVKPIFSLLFRLILFNPKDIRLKIWLIYVQRNWNKNQNGWTLYVPYNIRTNERKKKNSALYLFYSWFWLFLFLFNLYIDVHFICIILFYSYIKSNDWLFVLPLIPSLICKSFSTFLPHRRRKTHEF